MKRYLAFALVLALLALVPGVLADYSDSEAYNVAKRVIKQTLEDQGCTDFRFAIFDYNVHSQDDLYAVYADVKYVDARGKNQREYFAFMFRETKDGYEPYFLCMGTRFLIVPDGLVPEAAP